ncbi:MAG: Nramp family divalent metal transporter [Planctomycetota bacterium]|nr:Nramp family divalent metal transporter [Planctomycetota bacterium]
MRSSDDSFADTLPKTCLPAWSVGELPEPKPLSWRQWYRFIGPGLVMMGIQIGGGEWLLGPDITARYGGGLMWIASIAIIVQVFYNIECGRYALYCGEPVFTGFMRTFPGPMFWIGVIGILNFAALIPGLSAHGAVIFSALWLGHPPTAGDEFMVKTIGYVFLLGVTLPIFVGGKIYNMLQAVMTVKVFAVLSFCLLVGALWVSPANWYNVFSGFLKFGSVPTVDADNRETTVNVVTNWLEGGDLPVVAMANIALIGAFAGYAGGGGLGNATYSNFVRDKGWGMGSLVGAIPSAVGGTHLSLSHLGTVFQVTSDNLRKWKGWWRYILTDQVLVWAPGCFMGMALPALLSLEFAGHSVLQGKENKWLQSLITADGISHDPRFSEGMKHALWIITLLVGLLVMLPSQMSIVDDFSRRWTDILWSGVTRVRDRLHGSQVSWIYYSILTIYVLWSLVWTYIFNAYGSPRLMTIVIANLNNVAIGITSFHVWWINTTLLPKPLRPRWYQQVGILSCGVFYCGMSLLVLITQQIPQFLEWMNGKT